MIIILNIVYQYHTFLRVVVCIGAKATVLPINAADKRTRAAVDFILLLSILSMGNTTYYDCLVLVCRVMFVSHTVY